MADKFSYWDDDASRKHANYNLGWDDDKFYDEEGDPHEYQPELAYGQQVALHGWDNDEPHEITDFDPNDGQYYVNGPEKDGWLDPEDLEPWDDEVHGNHHDPDEHQEYLEENHPIGSWVKWNHPYAYMGKSHPWNHPNHPNNQPAQIIAHDPDDPGTDVQLRLKDGTTQWADANKLTPSSPDAVSPYAELYKPSQPGSGPRGNKYQPGDRIIYNHDSLGKLPGIVVEGVHPQMSDHTIVTLDKHQHPGLPLEQQLQTSVPTAQLESEQKFDKGPVNPDAGLPGGIKHPQQQYPIGSQVYQGYSGQPATVKDFRTIGGAPQYLLAEKDGATGWHLGNEVTDTFTPHETQMSWAGGPPVYYGGLPFSVDSFKPNHHNPESNVYHGTWAGGQTHTLYQPQLTSQPDEMPEGVPFSYGQTVYYGGHPHKVVGYDPLTNVYNVSPQGSYPNTPYAWKKPDHLLGDPNDMYPGQKYGPNDKFYQWNGQPLTYVGYEPERNRYRVMDSEGQPATIPESEFTTTPYTDEFTCKYCHGSGVTNTPCPTCGGAGQIEVPQDAQTDLFGEPKKATHLCPECHGAKEIPTECPYCNGTGNSRSNQDERAYMGESGRDYFPAPLVGVDQGGFYEDGTQHIDRPGTMERNKKKGLLTTCPACSGWGTTPDGASCRVCRGAGVVQGQQVGMTGCLTCGGSGYVQDESGKWLACPHCHGEGGGQPQYEPNHEPEPEEPNEPDPNQQSLLTPEGPCPRCGEDAWQPQGGSYVCGNCGLQANEDAQAPGSYSYADECPKCHGKGKDGWGYTCSKCNGAPTTPQRPVTPVTKAQFDELNPERHGLNSTGGCLVCGSPPLNGKIICNKHYDDWQKEREDFEEANPGVNPLDSLRAWAYNHPEYNGKRLDEPETQPEAQQPTEPYPLSPDEIAHKLGPGWDGLDPLSLPHGYVATWQSTPAMTINAPNGETYSNGGDYLDAAHWITNHHNGMQAYPRPLPTRWVIS
jgi:hypothetical protein